MTSGGKVTRFDATAIPRAILSGLGCRSHMSEEVASLGAARVLVVSGRSVRMKTPFVDEICGRLSGRIVAVFDRVEPNTPLRSVQAAANAVAPLQPDAVLSIGGGAVHDMAKAIAVMLPSGRSIMDFVSRFEPPDTFHSVDVDVEPLPVLTVPATFSAAEVVGGGAITDTGRGQKLIFVHPRLTPARVFLDGEVVASTPRTILAASGLNAVHHCLEAFYSKGAQPVTDAFALAGLRELFATLPLLEPNAEAAEPSVYQRALNGSALSGLTYANSWLGIGHSVCHSLGGRFGISHGKANSVILRQSLRFNFAAAQARLAAAGRVAGVSQSDDDSKAATALIDRVDALSRMLGAPERLRDLDLAEDAIEQIADDVLADPQTYWNPRPASRQEIIDWLKSFW
jgi:alcohol dehydrogenase class IV